MSFVAYRAQRSSVGREVDCRKEKYFVYSDAIVDRFKSMGFQLLHNSNDLSVEISGLIYFVGFYFNENLIQPEFCVSEERAMWLFFTDWVFCLVFFSIMK